MAYSICETVHGITWHVRTLSSVGQKFSGGADTPTLCGLKAAWDLQVDAEKNLTAEYVCKQCRETAKAQS